MQLRTINNKPFLADQQFAFRRTYSEEHLFRKKIEPEMGLKRAGFNREEVDITVDEMT